jgi:signal transduction histidine kinase
VVKVSDTGCGIPKEALPHVFDRFYQLEKSRQNTSGSAGLGLAIAKRILELHGSPILVDSEVNTGTTFTFFMPVHHY